MKEGKEGSEASLPRGQKEKGLLMPYPAPATPEAGTDSLALSRHQEPGEPGGVSFRGITTLASSA
jgi:hypothetical protein